ncbi:MAG: PH domain-containing protein [Dehalococcoidia bacterium]|nr:PH domain-containing protein [Dehalococcoidia bacterium]
MAVDIQRQARDFDDEFGSNSQRHAKKVAAIPAALKPDETVTFITDVKLLGAFRDDVLVATDSRLLVIRKNGKRIDEYDLSEISSLTLKDPDNLGSQLTVALGAHEFKASISSEPAAIALTRTLQALVAQLAASTGTPVPTLTEPNSAALYPDIWKLVITSDRNHGTSIANHRSKLLALSALLNPGESVLSLVDAKVDGEVHAAVVACTDSRLLTFQRDGDQVDSIDLASILSVTSKSVDRGNQRTITVTNDLGKWQATVASPDAAKRFVRTVSTAFRKHVPQATRTSQESAADATVTPAASDISSRPSPAHLASAEVATLTREPLLSLSDEGRDELHAHFANAFAFNVRKYSRALDALARIVTDEERLLCLIEINTDLKSTSNIVALTSENIIIQGPRAGGLDQIGLFEIDSISGTTATLTGTVLTGIIRILLRDGTERRFSSVPNAGIEPFVAAAESARSEQLNRIEQRNLQRLERLDGLLDDATRNARVRHYGQIAEGKGITLSNSNLRKFAVVDHLLQWKVPGLSGNDQPWRDAVLQKIYAGTSMLAEDTYEGLDQKTTEELARGEQDILASQLDFLALVLDDIEPGNLNELRTIAALLDFEEVVSPYVTRADEAVDVHPDILSGQDPGQSERYLPTAVHGLSKGQLTLVYDQIAAETVDFDALTDWQLEHLPNIMLTGELLIWLAEGYLQGSFKDPGDSGSTMIAITDRRLLLLVDPLLATNQHKAFRLTDISAVHRDGGFITGGFRFRESGGGQRKITKMNQASAEATVAKLQAAIDSARSSPAQPSQVEISDIADQLEKLANLVDRGFLTPEEFAEQKARLLNG